MVTLDDYLGGWDKDPRFSSLVTHELLGNAQTTLQRVNLLLTHYYAQDLSAAPIVTSSGWRPPEINAKTKGAAKASHHMSGEAWDGRDKQPRPFARFCWAQRDKGGLLERLGLWLEHPGATSGVYPWVHVQIVPPKSGVRVFIPSAYWARRLDAEGRLDDPFKGGTS